MSACNTCVESLPEEQSNRPPVRPVPDMSIAKGILGLCLVVGGCGAAEQEPDTDTDAEGESATSDTESPPETATSGTGMSTDEPGTTANSTGTSETTDGTSTGVDTMASGGSSGTSGGGNETTSHGSSESGTAESSTTDPDGNPFQGPYEGTMAADCVVGLLSGVLEFTVDASGAVDGDAEISLGAGEPLIAPVTGTVEDTGAMEASATVGGGLGACAVTGMLFDSGTGSGVFSCPVPACDGTWNASQN